MRKKFIAYFIFVILLLVGLVYQIPNFINWQNRINTYFSALESSGYTVSGLNQIQVHRGSNINIEISNFSISTAKKVTLVSSDNVSFEIGWFDLLFTKLTPRNISLSNPNLTINLDDKNGIVPIYNIIGTSLHNISLSNSNISFTYNNKNINIEGVSSDISFTNTQVNVSGTIITNSINASYALSTTKDSLNLSLSLPNMYNLKYQGDFNGDLKNPVSDGNLSLTISNLSETNFFTPGIIFPYLAGQISDLMPGAEQIQISGKISIKDKIITADSLNIDGGNLTKGTIKASYDFGQKMLSSIALNLDYLNIEKPKTTQETTNAGQDVTNDMVIYNEPKFFTLSQILMLDVEMSFSIKKIDFLGYTFNNFSSSFSIAQNQFKLNNFSIGCQDETTIELSNFTSQNITNIDVLIGEIKISGKNLSPLLSLLGLDEGYFNFLENTPYNLSSQLIVSPQETTFYGFNISANNVTYKGRWTVQNHDQSLGKYNISLEVDSLNINNTQNNQILSTIVSIIENSNNENYYSSFVPIRQISSNGVLSFKISNSQIGSTKIQNISAQANFAPASLDLKNISFQTDLLNFTGEISINSSSLRPKVNVNINFADLNFDNLAAIFGNKDVQVKNNANQSIWSNNSLSYFRLEKFDGSWSAKGNSLTIYGTELKNLSFAGTSQNNSLYITTFNTNIFGGNLDIKGNIANDGQNFSASLSTAFNDFQVNQLGLPQVMGGGIGGVASFSGSLVTKGKTPLDLVNNTTSAITIAVRGATFPNIDVNEIIAITTLSDNKIDKNNAIQALAKAYNSNSTYVGAIDGYLIIAQGIAQTKDLTFAQTYSNGQIQASLDLRYLLLNNITTFNIRPKENQLLSFSINLKGDKDNLTKTITDDQLIQYIRTLYSIPIPKEQLEQERIENSKYIYQKVIQ